MSSVQNWRLYSTLPSIYLRRNSLCARLWGWIGFAMNLYAQIRELLTQYASEQIDLQTFREKFVLLYRDGIRSDQETADLGKTVEVLYGDLLCNEFDEKTFIKKLLAIPAGLSKTKAPYAAIIELQFF